ncbi:MAG: 6,7-dimethyl-8-ribityllumazine synthase [Gammaproteobacteria bacterium]
MPKQSTQAGAYLVVTAQFNALVTERLAVGAREALLRAGIAPGDINEESVAGAWELPLVVAAAARSGRYRAVVACGAVIRGETPHFDHVSRAAMDGLAQVQIESLVPVGLAVLTTDTLEQALNRAGGKTGNKGSEAALAALEAASVIARLAKNTSI